MLQATQLYEELVQWYEDEVYLFTVEESLAAEYSIHSPEVVSNRIRTLQFLTTGEKGIVVVPLSGIQKPLVPLEVWKKSTIELVVGETNLEVEELIDKIRTNGLS